MATMQKHLRSVIPLQLILLLSFCSQSTGLTCYATTPNSEESSIDCADYYMMPSQSQLNKLDSKEITPKTFCFKRGFLKGCAWGHPDYKAKCSEIEDATVKKMSEDLTLPNSVDKVYFYGNGGPFPFDFTKQCICDTDYCNDGKKPEGPFLMIILISLFSTVAAL